MVPVCSSEFLWYIKKSYKILLAHGLPNTQCVLVPLDFYPPWATRRVEMSNPAFFRSGYFHVVLLYHLSGKLQQCFGAYFLEHEGALTAVNISSDGLYVSAGTKTVSTSLSDYV